MKGARHEDGPPPILELALDQLQLLGRPWALLQRLVPPRSGIGLQRPVGLPLPKINVALLFPMQEPRFFRRRILMPFRRELDSHGIVLHRVGILLSRNRIRLTGYGR